MREAIVQFSFQPEEEGEIPVFKGENVQVLSDDLHILSDGWILVQTARGTKGYVPRDYVLMRAESAGNGASGRQQPMRSPLFQENTGPTQTSSSSSSSSISAPLLSSRDLSSHSLIDSAPDTANTVAALIAARKQQAMQRLQSTSSTDSSSSTAMNSSSAMNLSPTSTGLNPLMRPQAGAASTSGSSADIAASLAARLPLPPNSQPTTPKLADPTDKKTAALLAGRTPLNLTPRSADGSRPASSATTPLNAPGQQQELWMANASQNLKRGLFNVVDNKEVSSVMKQNDEWFAGMMQSQRESFASLTSCLESTEAHLRETAEAADALILKISSYTKLR
jgi:hypothetical protein